ncbi:MAG: nucleoside kinase, partial [Bacteroidales bacterium]|nr:nucleoside kinase [Bacteroidales bacterium]
MITIYCVNTGSRQKFPEGTTLQDMVEAFDFERPHPIIAAKVNNVSQGLRYRAFNNRNVEFLDYTSYTGRGVYRRS